MRVGMDARAAIKGLENFQKQFKYANANALNRTAEDTNAALRQGIPQRFTVRQPGLLRHVAPVILPKTQRATKDNPTAVIKTEGLGRIFDPFEAGGIHKGTPDRPVAIPTQEIRASGKEVIPRNLYPSNLGLVTKKDPRGTTYFALGKNAIAKKLTPYKTTAHGATQIKGKRRTFVLDPTLHRGISPQQWGVYQRTGPGRGDIHMLWRYTRQVPRPPILHFEDTARRVAAERFYINFRGALDQALRTMK